MEPLRPTTGVPIVEARGVSKSFAGVKALTNVSLTLWPGEVHALMGENGAGKSTLMKVLAGLHAVESGQILLDGQPTVLGSPHEAIRRGIAMIHQELMPIADLTVAENILLGHEPASRWLGWIDRRAMRDEARRLLALLDVEVPVHYKMRQLSVAETQTVEIAKALGHNARVLIMDEPTAAISDREVEALFRVIAMLKQRGAAIVYITHKMDEVSRIADRITVLRDGANAGTFPVGELNRHSLIALMVGRELEATATKPSAVKDTAALSVRGLSRTGAFRDVSFDVRQGEILGITGLMGAGRTELLSAIFGLAPAESGDILVDGRLVRIRRPADAIGHRIGMVTEDRKKFGLVSTMTVKQNMTLASLDNCCLGPLIRHVRETAVADNQIRALGIRTAGTRQSVGQLSGGNQQKVVIARSLLAGPLIILLDEPTRGIDVGAKAEVHALVTRMAQEGKSIVLVSSEMPEVLALADRLLVMREGAIVAELDPSRTSQEEVLRYAMPV